MSSSLLKVAMFLVMSCRLVGCTETNPEPPLIPEPAFDTFVSDVQPILVRRCANPSCHGRSDRPFALYAQGAHRMDGSQTFSNNPMGDEEVRFNYDRSRSFALGGSEGSLLLNKPLAEGEGGVRHLAGGDVFLSRHDREFQALARWVEVGEEEEKVAKFRDLSPYPNPFGPDDPRWQEQPFRTGPGKMVLAAEEGRLFVALQGSVDRPGREVVAIDLESRRIVERYDVGSSPTGLAVHPNKRHLVVTNRFSNYLSVIDISTGRVTRKSIDFYSTEMVFDTRGERLYVANRWRDAVQGFGVRLVAGTLELDALGPDIEVGKNPEQLLLSPDEGRLFVASPTALTVSVIDTATLKELHPRLDLRAPPTSLSIAGGTLYVTTLSASAHHPAETGGEGHGYVPPVEGAANEGFEALQNELALFDLESLEPGLRYTSDSHCCYDFRDVRPDDPDLGHLLPDVSTWIVGGALPEASIVVEGRHGSELLVVYSGSSELQRFFIEEDGRLRPGPILSTGFDPRHVVVDSQRKLAVVSNRLGESVSVVDLDDFEVIDTISVSSQATPFPATDAEIGELVFFSGAAFSIDGDQTCNHCHRDRGNIAKAFSMPMLADTRGSRMTMATRGLWQARPWFMEGAMNEDTISAVLGEVAHIANFSDGAQGRNAWFSETSHALIGRERSFEDGIDVALDFDGITRLLGLFLIQDPALLPNPNRQDGPNVERGRLLFESAGTGCALCHPAPDFAASERLNPSEVPLLFGPVVTPNRDARGKNLDLVSADFLARFPGVKQSRSDLFMKAPTLLGLWDRAPLFYHDGRASSLRGALATPGHGTLMPGERGYNESDGVPDSHGGTSHLSPGQLGDLIEYLLTL
ncbi:MAG: hypothetical protein ACNA8W_11420 [Bradymonadaceae bacterium]